MKKLVYIDSGVLIQAAQGRDEIGIKAMELLNDPDLRYASGDLVKLEVLPMAIFHRNKEEAAFYETFFKGASAWVKLDPGIADIAFGDASRTGITAMDALHAASATSAGAEELITTEKRAKSLHRTRLVRVKSLLIS